MANAPNTTENTSKRLDLNEATLNRTIFALAVPAVLENLMYIMVFFADTFIVARLRDENMLAGTMLAGLTMIFLNAPFHGLAIAAGSLVSRYWGEDDFTTARRFAGQSVSVSFILAAGVLALCYPFAGQIIALLGASADVLPLGTVYFRIVLLSSLMGLPMIIANSAIRATGDTRSPMVNTVIMNTANVIISVILAFGYGPVKPMGMIGVAWGTVIARSLGGILSVLVLVSPGKGIRMTIGDFTSMHMRSFVRLTKLAAPAFADRLLHSGAQLAFIRIVAILGTTSLAAHNIALHVESLAFMPAVGISTAVAAIMGQAIGAQLPHIAELTVKRTMLFSTVLMIAIGLLFVIAAPFGARLFGATPEVVKMAGTALQISALELPFLAFAIILSASLRAAGDTTSPMYVTFVSLIIFRLCTVYLFAITFGWGLNGVWFATALDWIARSTGLYIFFRKGPWKLIHQREKQKYQ